MAAARQAGMTVVEVGALLASAPDRDRFVCLDGIHMTEPYHKLMAREWLKLLVGARQAELVSRLEVAGTWRRDTSVECRSGTFQRLARRGTWRQNMKIRVFDTKTELGAAAAESARQALRAAISQAGRARAIAATGASQFELLDALTTLPGIDWPRVELFHLDEYVGLPESHPASFRRYLKERIAERVHPGVFHFIDGEAEDPLAECRRVGEQIARAPIDVAFVGIGENGHLAFNDPPADFETEEPYLVSRSTRPAAASSSARAGSRASRRCRLGRSRCRCARS